MVCLTVNPRQILSCLVLYCGSTAYLVFMVNASTNCSNWMFFIRVSSNNVRIFSFVSLKMRNIVGKGNYEGG
eukprot:m.45249 g.45249  ORF g.45249 m.45249 type:complete len:72 (+) comp7209_c0_seq3:448-663(+)